MNRKPAVQTVTETNPDLIPQINPENKRLNSLIRLRRILFITTKCLFFYSFSILFQYIQQSVRVMISIFVINNRNLNSSDMKLPDASHARILT